MRAGAGPAGGGAGGAGGASGPGGQGGGARPLPAAGAGGAARSTDAAAYGAVKFPGFDFEYLDHTADIQIHAWGDSLAAAFASCALGMYNYITPLSGVRAGGEEREVEVRGHDLDSLLFNFLDELLFLFCTEFFVARELEVTALDQDSWSLTARGRGEIFSRDTHVAGTEVKAITYSAMQILQVEGKAEVFVIVDI